MEGWRTPRWNFGSLILVQDSQGALDRCHGLIRALGREQLPENNAVAIDVSGCRVGLVRQDLGCNGQQTESGETLQRQDIYI